MTTKHRPSAFQPRPLRCAIAISLALASLSAAAQAAEQNAAVVDAGATRAWNLPAAPLADTLARIARDSGRRLSADPTLVAGKTAAPVRGNLSAIDAARQALAGTGLELVVTEGGTLSVRPAPVRAKDREAMLAPVAVTASGLSNATTEGTGSYTTRSMNAATKLPLSIRETPQSVSVVTRQRMDDQSMTSIMDVVQNTPGLFVNGSGGVGRESFSARGFAADSVMEDGVVSSWETYIPGTRANLALYDRVEIVRGATGLMQGAGTPSTAINLVRKRPAHEFQGSISASAGSWDDYGAALDIGSPLNAAGTLRGRFVASRQDARSFRDVEAHDHDLFYGILEADLGRRTTLTIGAYRQKDHTNYTWGGMPISLSGQHLNLPRSFFPGTDWQYMDNKTTKVFGTLEHQFDNDWKLRLDASTSTSNNDILATILYREGATDLFHHYAWQSEREVDQATYDLSASGPFNLLGRKHELIVGAGSNTADQDRQRYADDYVTSGVDLNTWNPYSVARPIFKPSVNVITKTKRENVYLTTRLNLAEPLKLILGGRLDWYEYLNRSGSGSYKVTGNFTRYAGLVYDLDKQHSVYASYTDIFKPQTYYDTSEKLLDPVLGKNYEIGIKGEYFGGALNASAAAFQIDQTNRAKTITNQSVCPTYPAVSCYETSGLVRSKGVDLEVQGEIMPRWQMSAGLTYATAEYVRDTNASNIGKPFSTDTPKQLFKLSTLYTLPSDMGAWRIGGSVYQQSRIYYDGSTNGTAWRNQQRRYTLLDLVIGYRPTKHLDLQLNISNVFDKTYYKAITNDTSWWPMEAYGDPRKFKLTAKYIL